MVLLLLMMSFVTIPAALAIFVIEILTCCVVFYTIDAFAVFSTFDLDKLGKIPSALLGKFTDVCIFWGKLVSPPPPPRPPNKRL